MAYYGMMYNGYEMMQPYFGFTFWLWIIVIGFIIWILIRNNKSRETPVDILKERYAKGEINDKKFEEMKKHLK